jgi:TonB family protein
MRIKFPAGVGVAILAVAFSLAQNPVLQSNSDLETPAPAAAASNTEDVALGEPLEWMPPKYPKQALRDHAQGTVVLKLSVNPEGQVSNASVISGDPEFTDAALRSSRKWKYIPYYVNGRPAEVTAKVVFAFKIGDDGRPDVRVAFKYPPKGDAGSVFKVGHGVTAPRALYAPAPQYSDRARHDKYQGTCVLSIVVGPDGKAYDVRITRSLGEGLDDNAVEAVQTWRFQPGLKDGRPVSVKINVEVEFRLN